MSLFDGMDTSCRFHPHKKARALIGYCRTREKTSSLELTKIIRLAEQGSATHYAQQPTHLGFYFLMNFGKVPERVLHNNISNGPF